MPQKVLLTDTHWRTAYYVCKALAKKGIKVIGLKTVDSIFDKSSYYSDIIAVPSLETYPEEWLYKIQQIASGDEMLIPVSVEAIKFVVSNKARLSKILLVPPISLERIMLALDKRETLKFVESIGIPTPVTFYPMSLSEAEDALLETKFPVVLKLRQERNIPPQERYGIAYNIVEFRKLYRELLAIQSSLLMQEYISGQGVGVSILADKGTILAIFQHQRLREQFKTGGPSTFCSCFNSKVLEDYALMFARKSKWSGIAMLEFKYNPDKKTFYFMEVNPRFWGSMELAIISGVNFPYLFLEWVLGNNRKNVVRQSKTIKLKYLGMDIAAFSESIIGVDKKSKHRMFLSYMREYLDRHLRFAYIDIRDWRVSKKEVLLSIKSFGRMVKYVF
jgi:predicted ATP-grasp superfamily ATP-dependent carboligase